MLADEKEFIILSLLPAEGIIISPDSHRDIAIHP